MIKLGRDYRDNVPTLLEHVMGAVRGLPDGVGDPQNYKGGWGEYVGRVWPLIQVKLKDSKLSMMPDMEIQIKEDLKKYFFESQK